MLLRTEFANLRRFLGTKMLLKWQSDRPDLITEISTKVSSWAPSYALIYPAALDQSNAAFRPDYNGTYIQCRKNNSERLFTTDTGGFANSQEVALFWVGSQAWGSGKEIAFTYYSRPSPSPGDTVRVGVNGAGELSIDNHAEESRYTFPGNGVESMYFLQYQVDSLDFYLNGELATPLSPHTAAVGVDLNIGNDLGLVVGSGVTDGNSNNFNEFSDSDHRFLMLIDGVLSSAQIQKLFGWAAWNYGLQNLLPIDHPFKARPVYNQ